MPVWTPLHRRRLKLEQTVERGSVEAEGDDNELQGGAVGADREHPDLPTRRSEPDRGKKAVSDPAGEWGGTAQLATAAGGVATRRRGDNDGE